MNVVGELGTLPEQAELDLGLPDTAGEWLARIRESSRTETEKGLWFENLFARVARMAGTSMRTSASPSSSVRSSLDRQRLRDA